MSKLLRDTFDRCPFTSEIGTKEEKTRKSSENGKVKRTLRLLWPSASHTHAAKSITGKAEEGQRDDGQPNSKAKAEQKYKLGTQWGDLREEQGWGSGKQPEKASLRETD